MFELIYLSECVSGLKLLITRCTQLYTLYSVFYNLLAQQGKTIDPVFHLPRLAAIILGVLS